MSKINRSPENMRTLHVDRARLIEWFRKQERDHPVETWMYGDWHAWPILRMKLASRIKRRGTKQHSPCLARMKRPLRPIVRLLRTAASWRHSPNRCSKTGEMEYAVVAVTTARRPTILEGRAISPFAVVPMEWFETWKIPAISIEASCDKDLRDIPRPYRYCILEDIEPKIRRPFFSRRVPWRKAFRKMEKELGLDPVSFDMFEIIERKAELWRTYFKSHKTKLFLVTCWYGVRSTMPIVLAAKRLGIPVVDIQHGLRDKYHPAYAAWTKAPPHGYEVVPDFLWCWSQYGCRESEEANPGLRLTTDYFSGGNLWLNRNIETLTHQNPQLYRKAVKRCSKFTRTVFVCLGGHSLEHGSYPSLKWAIENTPESWNWMFRLHPKDREHRQAIEAVLKASEFKPRVDLDFSNELSLYECISLCDVMISDLSTCSQEGLAFGKPCVIIDLNGRDCYERQIAKGSMIFAQDRDIPKALRRAFHISAKTCKMSAEYFFNPKEKSCLAARSFFQRTLGVENLQQNVRSLE